MKTRAGQLLDTRPIEEAKLPDIDLEDINNGDMSGMMQLLDVMMAGMNHFTSPMSGVTKAQAKQAKQIQSKMKELKSDVKTMYDAGE